MCIRDRSFPTQSAYNMSKFAVRGLTECLWSELEGTGVRAVCVHPGGPRLMGPVAIRAAFEAMFANGTIQASPQHLRRVESVASAVHSLVERIEVMTPEGPRHAYVVATNVFHKTAQGWRMVVHHASPGTEHAAEASADVAQVLH